MSKSITSALICKEAVMLLTRKRNDLVKVEGLDGSKLIQVSFWTNSWSLRGSLDWLSFRKIKPLINKISVQLPAHAVICHGLYDFIHCDCAVEDFRGVQMRVIIEKYFWFRREITIEIRYKECP